jgi:lipoprotein-anchoring transpeptidase ErfK/SrfK
MGGFQVLRYGVAAATLSFLLVGEAQAFDLGAVLSTRPDANLQRTNVPTDLEIAPPVSGTTHVLVQDPTSEKPGTITVDTKNRYLYLSMEGGQAMRYDIGVGRDGFAWSGEAYVARRAEWPSWTPPADMLKRRPDIPHYMAGGLDNPLGARAMYLYNAHGDTMYRIHGTNEPDTIGHAVSSGCIRLLNADVIDLYDRVKIGAHVVVL